MKINRFIVSSLCLTVLILLAACVKRRQAKKLSGTYHCVVDRDYWTMGSGSFYDSIYYEDLEITRHGKFLNILGSSICVDDLWDEQFYSSTSYHDNITVQFKNDSIYVNKSSASPGSGYSFIYKGSKK